MYTISKEFHFSASHILEDLPEDHPCSRLHGHNYVIVVELQDTQLDHVGFVIDYRSLEPIKRYIDTELDHRHLNNLFTFNPTAENMAKHFFFTFKEWFPNMVSVTVKETNKTAAKYSQK